jgi:transcription initiation factor TFIIIB Brf1 subunit/transcription initiation factor TFIIB
MEECRKIIITYERELLDAIQYQFEIKHPCAFIIKFTRRLALEKSMAKTAWRLMVMVYRSTVPVYYGPHAVASACIFVAQKLYRETVDNPTEIFSIFSVFKLQLLGLC